MRLAERTAVAGRDSGSITLCTGYRAAAATRTTSEVIALGLDLELDKALSHGYWT